MPVDEIHRNMYLPSDKTFNCLTIILASYTLDNLVHCPSIKFLITHNLQWQVILHHIPLHSLLSASNTKQTNLQTIVPIPSYSLINTQQVKFNAVIISFIKYSHRMGQNSRVLAPTSSNSDLLAGLEKFIPDYRVVDFRFKDMVETLFTQLLRGFRTLLW